MKMVKHGGAAIARLDGYNVTKFGDAEINHIGKQYFSSGSTDVTVLVVSALSKSIGIA